MASRKKAPPKKPDKDHCRRCGHRYASKVHKRTCARPAPPSPPTPQAPAPPRTQQAPMMLAPPPPAPEIPAPVATDRAAGPWPTPGAPLRPPAPQPAPEAAPAEPAAAAAPPAPPPQPLNLQLGKVWKWLDKLDPDDPLTDAEIAQLDEATRILPIAVAPPVKQIVVPWYVGSVFKAAPVLVPRIVRVIKKRTDKMAADAAEKRKQQAQEQEIEKAKAIAAAVAKAKEATPSPPAPMT